MNNNPFADDINDGGGDAAAQDVGVRDYGIYNDDDDDSRNNDRRNGTVSSARFNILSTMVGGGCLSLPLAFKQSGNAFIGPVMLIVTGLITDFCFRLLVASANHLHQINHNNNSSNDQQQQQQQRSRNNHNNNNNDRSDDYYYHNLPPGKDTFESITSAAFGPKAYVFSMTLVVLMCFFGAVGYSVLLRDMMEPINDTLIDHLWGRHNNNTNSTTNGTTILYPPNSDDTNRFMSSSFLVAGSSHLWEDLFATSPASRDDNADADAEADYFHDYLKNNYFDDADDSSDDATTASPSEQQQQHQSWLQKNLTLFVVILLVTPFCTLRHLTALKDCGAASMTSVLILGSCIVFRSIQCNVDGGGSAGGPKQPWYTYLTYFPSSWRELLDAVPLYISCFVCHYNILPVHNELQNPTPKRVSWWLRSTTWFAVTLYMIMGFAGSSYAHCTSTGEISGNVLLDFDENDPLLFVGRMCLAVTITLAFPMLVIPARDIMIRSWIAPMLSSKRRRRRRQQQQQQQQQQNGTHSQRLQTVHEEVGESSDNNSPLTTQSHHGNDGDEEEASELEQPLLSPDETNVGVGGEADGSHELRENEDNDGEEESVAHISFLVLLSTSIVIFWTAGAVASCVESIDIVWDLLGSSLSILLSYLIPAGTYLVITARPLEGVEEGAATVDGSGPTSSSSSSIRKWSRVLCWGLILFFFPLMVVSTANAVVNTFF